MTEYFIPTKKGNSEITEKRSRFIGHVIRCETEEDARNFVAAIKAEYHDARHNCWCYIIRDGGILRYSDDGEPQGTAGQPMLDMFQRSGIENVCCVVTRYFGGILLGPGGLIRAYTQCAKDALSDAGISVVRMWNKYIYECSYSLYERVKNEISTSGGVISETEYGAAVTIEALIPEGCDETLNARLCDISSNTVCSMYCEDVFRDVPIN